MSLNIFVSQQHIQNITNKHKTGMYAEDLHRLERNSYQMRLCFYTFFFSCKMTNICRWESTRYEKTKTNGSHNRK